MSEEWCIIPGWPYEASSNGRIRRNKLENNTYIGKILSQREDRYGYPYVVLCNNGITKTFKVHRLICLAFYEQSEKKEVRHLNGIRNDNRVENLCWGTFEENMRDRDQHNNTLRGERSPRAKFTQKQVDNIRKQVSEARRLPLQNGKMRQRVPRGFIQALSIKYNVSVYTITNLLNKGYGI